MSIDLSQFASEGFDPKLYINQACSRITDDDKATERQLAELEMKLHLAGEDLALYLQDHSIKYSQRVPAAIKELLRVKVSLHFAYTTPTPSLHRPPLFSHTPFPLSLLLTRTMPLMFVQQSLLLPSS